MTFPNIGCRRDNGEWVTFISHIDFASPERLVGFLIATDFYGDHQSNLVVGCIHHLLFNSKAVRQ